MKKTTLFSKFNGFQKKIILHKLNSLNVLSIIYLNEPGPRNRYRVLFNHSGQIFNIDINFKTPTFETIDNAFIDKYVNTISHNIENMILTINSDIFVNDLDNNKSKLEFMYNFRNFINYQIFGFSKMPDFLNIGDNFFSKILFSKIKTQINNGVPANIIYKNTLKSFGVSDECLLDYISNQTQLKDFLG